MNVAIAAGSALGAAALFATGTAAQARALHGTDRPALIRTGLTSTRQLRDVLHAFRSPFWIAGTGVAAIGFGLHALALHEGNLSFVQPLLVTMVIFAMPATWIFGGPRPDRTSYVWAVVLIFGLSAFFAAAEPASRHAADVDTGPAILTAGLAALTIAGCVALARRREGTQGAALLGAAAGIAFAAVAALLKTDTNTLSHGILALLGTWQLYALLAVGAVGVLLSQLAYRVGPLSASLPALNSVNPLVSVVIGVAVFDERFRTGIVASTIEAVGLVTVTIAVIILSRPHPNAAPPGAGHETPRASLAPVRRRRGE